MMQRRRFLTGLGAGAALGGVSGALAGCVGSKRERKPAPAAAPAAIEVQGASDTAKAIAAGSLSPAEAAMRAIKAAAAINPRINALAFSDFARAGAAADLPAGRFKGVPFAIKDLADWPGMPTGRGSRAYAGAAGGDRLSPFLARVKAMGLNPIGKSTTPEFGLTATTEPLATGLTRNPYDPNRSAGGSSGGAAALVASGVLPFAHASDGGGSIRIPAACCGLVGLKPSWGRFPTEGGVQRERRVEELSVQGVLTRNVRDTAAFFAEMELKGDDAALRPVGLVEGPGDERLRIAFSLRSPGGAMPDAETVAALTGLARRLEKFGHSVEMADGALDDADLASHFMLLWAAGAAEAVGTWAKAAGRKPDSSVFEPWTLGLVEHFEAHKSEIAATRRAFEAYERSWETRFVAHHLIMTPVLGSPAAPLGFLSPELPFAEHLERVSQYAGYTGVANAAGAPALAVPVARAASGLPIAAQFFAPVGGERRLLELAYALESEINWAAWRPAVFAG